MYVDDYGLEALLLCIFQNMTPEQAFEKLERKRKYSKFTEKDLKEMVRMKSKGMTYTQIGEMYGLTRHAAYRQIKRYKEKCVGG